MLYNIYTLIDPICGSPFYVGATKQKLNDRLRLHIKSTKNQKSKYSVGNKKNERISEIINSGKTPTIKLLEIVTFDNVNISEKKHYDKFVALGFKLLQSKSHFNYTKRSSVRNESIKINSYISSGLFDYIEQEALKDKRTKSQMIELLLDEVKLSRELQKQENLIKQKNKK